MSLHYVLVVYEETKRDQHGMPDPFHRYDLYANQLPGGLAVATPLRITDSPPQVSVALEKSKPEDAIEALKNQILGRFPGLAHTFEPFVAK